MSQDAPPEPAPAEPSAAPSTSRRLLGVVGVLVLAGGLVLIQGCSGTRPANLGVTDGRLQPPPSSPNCVSSQADPGDAEHYVEPLTYTGPLPAARERLLRVLAELDLEVIEARDDYVYAEATSFLLRFVDDVEFYFPPEGGVVHCRSASRLGHSDFGVNRERIEAVRAAFAE